MAVTHCHSWWPQQSGLHWLQHYLFYFIKNYDAHSISQNSGSPKLMLQFWPHAEESSVYLLDVFSISLDVIVGNIFSYIWRRRWWNKWWHYNSKCRHYDVYCGACSSFGIDAFLHLLGAKCHLFSLVRKLTGFCFVYHPILAITLSIVPLKCYCSQCKIWNKSNIIMQVYILYCKISIIHL